MKVPHSNIAMQFAGMVVVFFLVLLTVPAALGAQPSGIVVHPLENRTGDTSLDALASTIRETLLLNLRLLAASGGADAGGSVTGTIDRDTTTGEFVIAADLQDPRTGETVGRPEVRAAGLLAVFDAADELTNHVLVALAGRRIEYGSFVVRTGGFTPGPVAGELEFTLGDQPVGQGTTVRLTTVVTGSYELIVRQERLRGPEIIHRETVRIEPNRETIVPVTVPLLTESEEEYLAEQDAIIHAALTSGSLTEAQELLNRMVTTLSEAAGPGPADGYRMMAERYRRRGAALALRDTPPPLPPPQNNDRVFTINTMRRMFWIPAADRAYAASTVAALVERYRVIPYRSIRVDGDFDDWEGVPPVITSSSTGNYRQLRGSKPATEIEAVYLAQDDTNFYVQFVLSNGEITTTTQPEYKVWLRPDSGNDQIGMQVRWAPWDNRWQTVVFQWSRERGWFELSTREAVRVAGNTFEARFPRRFLDQNLTRGRMYQLHTETGTADHATRQWWSHHALNTQIIF